MAALPAIEIRDAGKRYVKYEDRPLLSRASLNLGARTTRRDLWAVRHINLEVNRGECLGVIGRNGAGKSTMLRMLAGVTAPSEGSVTLRGRIAPLVSVGVGFHPELTGRENIYVNGTILGLSRREIDAKFESILEFAEIGHFLDTPVKFYSSGMFVRLGFSVAVQAEPDILLVDEVLSVGDVAFQIKCFNRMMEIREKAGTTVLVVSHNLSAIRMMCDRAAVLSHGEMKFDGPTPDAISVYHDLLTEMHDPNDDLVEDTKPLEPDVMAVQSFDIRTVEGGLSSHFEAGEDVVFHVEVEALKDVDDPVFTIIINDATGRLVYKEPSISRASGHFAAGNMLSCDIRLTANLPTASYVAHLIVLKGSLTHRYSHARPAMFFVTGRVLVAGLADLHASFTTRTLATVSEQ
ncbi:MAG: lipopolysaccharide transport system ATP-binding protein [Chloroflexota bacterium]|jgi:lipopolysaccharide transport system ATP-binding protein|nr:lipopolysaccharide transport system ATP-binding protein [Chloroflexota bacterium]